MAARASDTALRDAYDPSWQPDGSVLRPLPGAALLRARTIRRWRVPWLKLFLAALCITGLSAYALHGQPVNRAGQSLKVTTAPAHLIAPEPDWRPAQSGSIYRLETAGLALTPPQQESRLHASGGREDTLVSGKFAVTPYLRMTIAHGLPDDEDRSFYVDLVLKAATSGLAVSRNAQPTVLATKFGAAELSETMLTGKTGAICLAFRLHRSEPSFALNGWLCGADGKPADPRRLACLIDRLTLADPAKALELAPFFVEVGRQKTGSCDELNLTSSQLSQQSRRR